jgi:mRNA-degrading endonuclease YafQ of YafQ-DinJ toxin-antitoxin module
MMVELSYKPSFVRQMNALEKDLAEEAIEKIELFKNKNNHKALRVHKLHGRLAGRFSFSVNFKYRIVFQYVSQNEIVLLGIGDHDAYK